MRDHAHHLIGIAANKKVLASFQDDRPDGLTIEKSGHLWAASYGSGRIIKVNPETGKEEDSVSIPCPLTTALAFGGPDFEEIFVTTAYKNFGPDLRPTHPTCGKVHRVSAPDNSLKGGLMFRPKDV